MTALRVGFLPALLLSAVSLHAWGAPYLDQLNPPGDPIEYSLEPLGGRVASNKRAGRPLKGVTDENRADFEAAVLGEIRITARGFAPGTYQLEFGNVTILPRSRDNRITDILVNGEVVIAAYNHFERFGMQAAGTVAVEASTEDGVFTIEFRKTAPRNAAPRFSFVRFLDMEGNEISMFSARRVEPPNNASQRWSRGTDEFEVPPFEASYKVRADEPDRLTPADIIGPDGIAYPNWTRVGVEGGIPHVATVVKLSDFGAEPDSGQDISGALEDAARAAGEKGGGAVLLDAGTYFIDRPVFIHHDGVVIRGAGRGHTQLIFRYRAPERGADFFTMPDAEGKMGPSSQIFGSGHPDELKRIALVVEGEVVSERVDLPTGTYEFMAYTPGWRVLDLLGPGVHKVTVVAEYYSGEVVREDSEIEFVEGPRHENQRSVPGQLSAINFIGGGPRGDMAYLATDGLRGDLNLTLKSGHNIQAGDRISIHAPATERWNKLVRNSAPWGDYRRNISRVTRVDGDTVTLEDPLRLPFPVVDGAYVQKADFIDRVGVEDLQIEQAQRLWTNGVYYLWAWEPWLNEVDVTMAGRHSYYMNFTKRGEIRDCVFDRTWYDVGGGTSYIGFERAYDCLMEGVTTRHMRHAPNLQWAAAGNVIRNSHFIDSDAQFHAGWTNENLIENCVIESSYQNGSYGFGIYSSAPEAGAHGPTGPRNVIYNCDISSPSIGFRMGGMNENTIVAYNRFTVGKGPAITMRHASFDHIIRGNVFIVLEPWPSVFTLATRDCIGVELIDNIIIGPVSVLVTGQAKPLVDRGNTVRRSGLNQRPKPEVPSIFAWQQEYGARQLAERN